MNKKNIKIALIASAGGHFEQMTNLSALYDKYDHVWITNEQEQTRSVLPKERKYFIVSAHYKKPWLYLHQLPTLIKMLLKEKPTHMLSTGSGRTAFIPFILSRLFKVKFIPVSSL